MSGLPARFEQTIGEVFGEAGRDWLRRLPELRRECERRWHIRVGAPFELSYNYVAAAERADGTPVVLKMGVPNPELFSEMEALQLYEGRGIARLLEADRAQGAMLLERLMPGTPLYEVAAADDDQATRLAAEVMQALWRPVPPEKQAAFPTAAQWAEGLNRLRVAFDGGTGPFPTALVEQAERLFADLLAEPGEPVLLHGDLHHANILRDGDDGGWRAVDPKGLLGDPAFEAAALLRNPPGSPLVAARAARRVAIIAEVTGLPRGRLAGWGYAGAVLASAWAVEDGTDPSPWLSAAEAMAPMAA